MTHSRYHSESILVWASLPSRVWDKDLGACSTFGKWSQNAGVRGWKEWNGEGREANKWDVTVLFFTVDNWGLNLVGTFEKPHKAHLKVGLPKDEGLGHCFSLMPVYHCLKLSLGCSGTSWGLPLGDFHLGTSRLCLDKGWVNSCGFSESPEAEKWRG